MEDANGRNRQLELDDKRYIWHPFTQMQDYSLEAPLIIEKGEGCTLVDIHGKAYLDGVSSLWTNVHGHRKRRLDLAVREQLDRVAHSTLLGLSNVPAIELAKKLVAIAPQGLTKVFYSDNGSTAVEIALKMAFQYHQQTDGENGGKRKFIAFKNAYHGDTIGSVSVGGIDIFHEKYSPLLFHAYKAESPYCYRCPWERSYPSCGLECLMRLEALMKAHAHEVCALVIEPLVQGAAGMLIQPPGFLEGVRDLCTKYDILMIADEVAVGFGKTGRMFACDHGGIAPDMMALAKGISGGYLPLAATLTTEKIYEGFLGRYEELKTFFHGHTYTGNPLACAAAIANLDIFKEERLLEELEEKIRLLTERLESFKSLLHVGDIRQLGIMVGIELVADRLSKRPFEPKEKIGHRVILEARRRGLIIRPLGNVIVLMPPLSISTEEIERLCHITFTAIRAVTEGR
ncbi:MAG TPA: adenosylmethionine--8-amino-7-oxononanoate transaminase [Syntrophobacteria bacterium]|nr:adenosylmethionine--8-amino-7-oxononanoate transaminase [Syntrophobacteria bacterium]